MKTEICNIQIEQKISLDYLSEHLEEACTFEGDTYNLMYLIADTVHGLLFPRASNKMFARVYIGEEVFDPYKDLINAEHKGECNCEVCTEEKRFLIDLICSSVTDEEEVTVDRRKKVASLDIGDI